MLFAKTPSLIEIYNDLDLRLVNFFRVLKDSDRAKEFHRLCSLASYSREEFYYYRDTMKKWSDIEQAWKFFICIRQGFGRKIDSFGYEIASSRNGMNKEFLLTYPQYK